ncbi:circularly permuted type 2 ATP-grasp protein [Endozoicomonas sp. SM1973]|uniref:Circularly permuted type 2 ATP-grasp protein n=1 Tax=Spartinivicinus marinus TaxID=2994442 RepID=A0A853ICX8_9GAMM|nr:circularly permuted type 2 ATP-grasp protein [Spartinivicinus marinus]NYZ67377.1 circularly permuted type 2 ATP-grasp protein [Spartinivicinus marinus]
MDITQGVLDPTSLPEWISQYLAQHPGKDAAAFHYLQHLSSGDINHRATEIKRLLLNSGFVNSGGKRSWQLDPLPWLVPEAEWQQLEQGVIQRVRLLDAILCDLQGARGLLTQRLIAAEQLFAHSEYLRERYSLPISETGLFLVAMDVGRDYNGQFYLLNDYCQVPEGLGVLLEHRIIARRIMSEEFAECQVERIADFFHYLQQAISQSTLTLKDPRVVILTSGPDDPYYSEHAFLATYLGYTLVRSADLTVRKGKVWLKSLDGLKKVNVILRWIDDRFLDTLEQADFSQKGIPGLLQAVRSQTVKLLNPFGNGLLMMPTIRTHAAQIAQYLLGEQLLLAEPETVPAMALAEADWPSYELCSYWGATNKLDGALESDEIRSLINAIPEQVFFQRKINLTEAPFWQHKQLQAKPMFLRCFALVHKGEISVLPSALCMSHSMDNNILIKDTWVQTQSPTELAPVLPKSLRKTSDLALVEGLIPSRTAENLFWLGSYLERCEDVCRLLRLFIDLFTELAIYPDVKSRIAIARIKAAIEQQLLLYPYKSEPLLETDTSTSACKQLAHQCIYSLEIAGSVHSTLSALLGSTMQVRELLSYDSLRIVESLEVEARRLKKEASFVATHMLQSMLDRVIGLLMAFNGSVVDSISNSNGWFVLDIGRRLERSTQLASMVAALLCDELPEAQQQSLLEAVLVVQVSSITHRRRYRMYQGVDTGIELLLLDAEYPRSLAFQVKKLTSLCKWLPSKSKAGFMSITEKALLRLFADCNLIDRHQLCRVEDGSRLQLQQLMELAKQHLEAFKEILQVQYFSHTKTAHKLNWSTDPVGQL